MQQGMTDRTWTAYKPAFAGQLPAEEPLLIARAHPARLMLAGWPLWSGLALLIVLLWEQTQHPEQGTLWSTLELGVGAATLIALVYWLIVSAYPWWTHIFIATNQRIIASQNGIQARSTALFVEQVQTVRSVEQTFWDWLLRIGTLRVDGASGQFIEFHDLRAPRQVAEQILATRDRIAATRPLPHMVVDDPTIQQMLQTLSQPDPLPQATALPGEIASQWPLRRAVHVPLEPGEKVIGVIGRHWWALAVRLSRPAMLFLLAGLIGLVGARQHADFAVMVAIPAVVGLVWSALAYVDFIDDVFFVTTQRVIDVDRRFFVLFESQLYIPYDKIQVIAWEEPTLLSRMLGFGSVVITSASGKAEDTLRMTTVPAPKQIAAVLDRSFQSFKQRSQVIVTNQKRVEMKDWFADVMSELIATTPDLRGQHLNEAVALAQQFGLHINVIGEVAVPGVAAGVIVSQNPRPHSRCLRGGDLTVMLSRM